MKRIIKLVIVCCLPLMLFSQAITYTMDTSAFEIVKGNDTLLAMNENGNLFSKTSFQVQAGNGPGKIRLRSISNPSLIIKDDDNTNAVEILSSLNGSGGAILLSDMVNGDTNTIRLVTNYASTNDARIITDELQINGGADLAEMFDINEYGCRLQSGLLVSIDPNDPGKLKITSKAYDPRIAGVVAGANGVKPGILMGQEGTVANGDDLVTLSGRTYIKTNTSSGKIRPGDFLTSSSVPGEAMKAKNQRKSRGAIIGKAMTALDHGSDFVLVLVNLQ